MRCECKQVRTTVFARVFQNKQNLCAMKEDTDCKNVTSNLLVCISFTKLLTSCNPTFMHAGTASREE